LDGGLIFVAPRRGATARWSSFSLYFFFIPDSRWLFSYSARLAALTWPNMGGGAPTVGAAAAAAAGAFGFVVFLAAKAPDTDVAVTARTSGNLSRNQFLLGPFR
jgi:hypothetical protein